MMAFFGSILFKIAGAAGIAGTIVFGIWLGVAKGQLHFANQEIASLRKDLAGAEQKAATWETVAELNKGELERLTIALDAAKRAAERETESLRRERDSAAASYRKLKAEIADVASTDDRNLGPVGQRGYAGLRARHIEAAP